MLETPNINDNEIKHPDLEDQRAKETGKRPADYASEPSLWYKLKQTWKGKTKIGRIAGTILDIGETFLPKYVGRARDLLQSKQKDRPMLSKILSIKNFINVYDEDGNFSWSELGASLLQIVLAGAIVYGAMQLGIWKGLMRLMEG